MSEKQVTSLEEMRAQARGEVVTIPGWAPGQTVNVRVRQVDLTAAILAAGALPNVLASALPGTENDQEGAPEPTPEQIEKLIPVLDAVAREALTEPKYDEIVSEAAPLTFEQKLAVFDAAIGNVRELRSFRGGAKSGTADSDG